MTPTPLIIDTDPGYDDAFAILLALASPELDVLGLTTVAGNVALPDVTANARRLVELAGRAHLPVHAGPDRPLLRPPIHAPEVHGPTGMAGHDWPPPQRPHHPRHALDWLVETLSAAAPKSVTLAALGPQTNLAMLLRRAPELASRIRRVVVMGGAYFQGGNASPAAEFNILVDPEAAAIVFASGIDLVAMPIDCTNLARAPADWVDALHRLGPPVGRACAGMMRHSQAEAALPRPLHDAVAMAWLLWPELFAGRHCNVEIETASPLTLGATVVDWRGRTGRPRNCLWITECDAPTLYARMLERLARL